MVLVEPRGQVGVRLLRRAWELSADRLEQRCVGLSDAELLWEPVPDSWNLIADPEHPGGWTYQYEFSPPQPHPVTTIGWRLVHITADNWIYTEHAFGAGIRDFPDLPVHGTAVEALADWRASREPLMTWLDGAHDDDLGEPRPSHLGEPMTAGEVVRILLDEQIHHGAEIALLRDLYRRRHE
ncbi:DinB family protein [Occultella kanbiaonis]|uniref:DinB family protein n=1 Tax=Occultella kanbiaonis TaxID=2675754 RepID=UPI0012B723F1|nr:DinB family protein [Occultella kanbiaonis]